jgi:hypothetical protein
MQTLFMNRMEEIMKKIFRQIHLWLSVPFGLIIASICFSGAMLVFENEVVELTRHELYYVKKVETVPLSVDRLLEEVELTLPDSVSVTGISIFPDPERTWQVNLSRPHRASMYVDPYTGEIKGKYERPAFFVTMFRLHRWLLDSMRAEDGVFWGKMIVGFSTLLFVVVLISGIVIWWPRTRKALKNSLSISVGRGFRRFWYDLHVAGGMYALLFLLAMALTGLTWSFGWYRTGFYKVFGVEVQQGGAHGGAALRGGRGSGQSGKNASHSSSYVCWQQVYEQLALNNPGYKQITLSDGVANVSFNTFGNQRASDRYTFNPRSGKIDEVVLYKDAEKAGKIRGWIYSVHVGSWGGMLTRLLTFIAALIGATLPLTGYYLWIKRSWRKKVRVR